MATPSGLEGLENLSMAEQTHVLTQPLVADDITQLVGKVNGVAAGRSRPCSVMRVADRWTVACGGSAVSPRRNFPDGGRER